MKNKLKIFALLLTLLIGFKAAQAQEDWYKPCGSPIRKNCSLVYDEFEPFDLMFNTGRVETSAGHRVESEEFFAVILESVAAKPSESKPCVFISEKKRLAAQKLFPKNKVFASRNACRGTLMLYGGTDDNYNFMAIYGGATEAQAKAVLKIAQKTFPSANIRKMTAILDFTDGQAEGDYN